MAIVIPFAPRERSGPRRRDGVLPGAGTILFFTGVRYERQPEPILSIKAPALRSRTAKAVGVVKAQRRGKSAGQPA